MIIELVIGTWAWWTNICIICDLNDKLPAPSGGVISSGVANGFAINGKTRFKITANIQALRTQL